MSVVRRSGCYRCSCRRTLFQGIAQTRAHKSPTLLSIPSLSSSGHLECHERLCASKSVHLINCSHATNDAPLSYTSSHRRPFCALLDGIGSQAAVSKPPRDPIPRTTSASEASQDRDQPTRREPLGKSLKGQGGNLCGNQLGWHAFHGTPSQ
jgi:hypothetical protein